MSVFIYNKLENLGGLLFISISILCLFDNKNENTIWIVLGLWKG